MYMYVSHGFNAMHRYWKTIQCTLSLTCLCFTFARVSFKSIYCISMYRLCIYYNYIHINCFMRTVPANKRIVLYCIVL
jgi:hypothetical protein